MLEVDNVSLFSKTAEVKLNQPVLPQLGGISQGSSQRYATNRRNYKI